MKLFIIFGMILGVALAQRNDNRDCDHNRGSSSSAQDIYQRPSPYDSAADYTPQTSYGPPDGPVRSPLPRRNYPQDISEGETSPRATYVQPPAPVYGPPPSRARVAAAAGIYEDYDGDIIYAQPGPPPPPPSRRYNSNYAQREPYYPRYDAYYGARRPEYRVPVYYSPLIPDGFIPVHAHSPTPAPTDKSPSSTTTTEETHSPPVVEPYQTSSSEQEGYEDGQVRRQQPAVIAISGSSPLQNEIKRHLFLKPLRKLRNFFRGSILAKRNAIGLIPSLSQGSSRNL